jgi:CheY-like chemotaxis protein
MRNTVLYVDDNRDHLLVLEARLMRLGYDVLSAGSGAEALNIFASNQVDLAVVDYYMPGMNGDIVALEMKNLKPQVPIIMFSGTFSLPALVVAIVEGFVSTSYAPDALTQKIQELLYLRKAQKAS